MAAPVIAVVGADGQVTCTGRHHGDGGARAAVKPGRGGKRIGAGRIQRAKKEAETAARTLQAPFKGKLPRGSGELLVSATVAGPL